MPPVLFPEFPPIAIISAIALLIPLPWHWRARNVATLSIILWLFISNMIYGTDAIIWKDNVALRAKVWCDITTKLMIGINFALPAACLCISMHLEHVASARSGPRFVADKYRRQAFEFAMCFGFPIIFMGLHYIVQGHRYDVFQGFGCRPSTYFSVPALLIVWIPPLTIATIAMVYSGLALRHFLLRRLTFAAMLTASKSALTTSRYIRLMLMAALQMVWSIAVTTYDLWFTATNMVLRPWTTWADVHSDFNRIDQYPIIIMPKSVVRAYYIGWWVIPVSSWLFIAFFAFGRDAIDEYMKCITWCKTSVMKVLPRRKSSADKHGFVNLDSPRVTTVKGLPISLPKSIQTVSCDYTDASSKRTASLYDSSLYPSTSSQTLPAYPPYALGPRAIGSVSDLVPRTPCTPSIPQDYLQTNPLSPPITALSPPPSRLHHPARPRPSPRTPVSPRPLTYPSLDVTDTQP